MGVYNVHGGHSLVCRGTSGILDEVNEDRKVKNKVIELLRAAGHTVYDTTDDVGRTQSQNLSNIVSKCNAHKVDLDVSIHLNSARNDYVGDGITGGVEVFNYDERTKAISDRICNNVSKALDLRIHNTGTRYEKNLYVLRNTNSLAILVECCFVDDKDDADRWNAEKCAEAIVAGILGKSVDASKSTGNTGKNNTVTQPSSTPATPNTKSGQIDVTYQAFAQSKGWLNEVVNYNNKDSNGYSGYLDYPIIAFRAKTKGAAKDVGYLQYRAHLLKGGWLSWRTDYNTDNSGDTFAGTMKQAIDGIQFNIKGIVGHHVKYRVHVINKGWLDWVTDYGSGNDGYAGIIGYAIDAIQVEII